MGFVVTLLHHDRAMMARFLGARVPYPEVSESGIIERYPPCNILYPVLTDPPALHTLRIYSTMLYALLLKRNPIVCSAIAECGGRSATAHIT